MRHVVVAVRWQLVLKWIAVGAGIMVIMQTVVVVVAVRLMLAEVGG